MKYLTKSRKAKIRLWKTYVLLGSITLSACIIGYSATSLEKLLAIKPLEVKNSPVLSNADYMTREFKKAGIDPYEAYSVFNCESHFNTEAININPKHGSIDLGLYQLNTTFQPQIKPSCSLDLKCSTIEAIKIYKKAGSFSPWACAKKLNIK